MYMDISIKIGYSMLSPTNGNLRKYLPPSPQELNINSVLLMLLLTEKSLLKNNEPDLQTRIY